jgi:hypothetical protein
MIFLWNSEANAACAANPTSVAQFRRGRRSSECGFHVPIRAQFERFPTSVSFHGTMFIIATFDRPNCALGWGVPGFPLASESAIQLQ